MIIKVNDKSRYWNELQLVAKFPPMNHFAWKYGVDGRTEHDREHNRFFIAYTSYPIIDPWRRPFFKWTPDGGETENEWVACTEEEHTGFLYRYASVQKKLVKLYLHDHRR
jgi:hypothetical protein